MVLNARLDALDAADLLVLSAVLEYGRQAHPSSALTMEMFFFFWLNVDMKCSLENYAVRSLTCFFVLFGKGALHQEC